MSPSDWAAVAAVCLTVLAGAVGYGMLRQRVRDLEAARVEDRAWAKDQLLTLAARVTSAETAASQVQGLAGAVEHMGERVADQMKYLTDTFALRFDGLAAVVDDLKGEVRNRRRLAPRAKAPKA